MAGALMALAGRGEVPGSVSSLLVLRSGLDPAGVLLGAMAAQFWALLTDPWVRCDGPRDFSARSMPYAAQIAPRTAAGCDQVSADTAAIRFDPTAG